MQCVRCFGTATGACSVCPTTGYCSKQCQQLDWSRHRIGCGRIYTGKHEDLNWVRGTNSTIFLSCYLRNGRQWRLLSKGKQFRYGFVPMSETVDDGIRSFAGVNFENISAYPVSMIHGSGKYATRATPFERTGDERFLATNLIDIAYAIMRIKQYDGIVEFASKFHNNLRTEEIKRTLQEHKNELRNLQKLLLDDETLPNEWQALTLDQKRQVYIAFLNTLRKKHGFTEAVGLDNDLFNTVHLKRLILKPEGQFLRFIADSYTRKTDFISRMISVKLFLPDAWPELYKRASVVIQNYLFNIGTIEFIYGESISQNPPVFALTDADKEITASPIPLIIASTITTGYRMDASNPLSELVLPGEIQIGASDANVIIVRQQDKKQLKKLLCNLSVPIGDVEIRVDDTVFQKRSILRD